MATVRFTQNLARYVTCESHAVQGDTVSQALRAVVTSQPQLEPYLFDDQDHLRRHVAVFVDGRLVDDREHLGDPIRHNSEIYVMQALSGG